MTHVVVVCGSLSRASSNRAALDVVGAALRTGGASVDEFERLAEIPAFDPDREDERQPRSTPAPWPGRSRTPSTGRSAAPTSTAGRWPSSAPGRQVAATVQWAPTVDVDERAPVIAAVLERFGIDAARIAR
jgi:hypothetical protein